MHVDQMIARVGVVPASTLGSQVPYLGDPAVAGLAGVQDGSAKQPCPSCHGRNNLAVAEKLWHYDMRDPWDPAAASSNTYHLTQMTSHIYMWTS